MHERTRPVMAVLSFLTAVPVGRRAEIDRRDLRRGAVLFPLVGAMVGALVATVAWGAGQVLPPYAAAILGVASGVVATAALHLDGLGDVADGIGASLGGSDPTEAMRDPRLGTFGIAAVALDLLLKSSLLSALVVTGFPWEVVAAGSISRVSSSDVKPSTLASGVRSSWETIRTSSDLRRSLSRSFSFWLSSSRSRRSSSSAMWLNAEVSSPTSPGPPSASRTDRSPAASWLAAVATSRTGFAVERAR